MQIIPEFCQVSRSVISNDRGDKKKNLGGIHGSDLSVRQGKSFSNLFQTNNKTNRMSLPLAISVYSMLWYE